MASKRFCDLCSKEITPEEDKPFIRFHPDRDIKISMIVTNSRGSVETDICTSCRLLIAMNGLTPEQRAEKPLDPAAIAAATSLPNVPRMGDRKAGGGSTASKATSSLPYVRSINGDKSDKSPPASPETPPPPENSEVASHVSPQPEEELG